MKKLEFLLCAFVLILACAGCGTRMASQEKAEPADPATEVTTETAAAETATAEPLAEETPIAESSAEETPAARSEKECQPGTVVILATGGTIAGSDNPGKNSDYIPGVLTVEQLLDSVPELSELNAIEAVQLFNKGSDDITHEDMANIARTINEMSKDENIAGFVVTHGTDTLEETAYFLHLTVKTEKPVVVTGSMRPATATSADGAQNLYESVKVAGSPESAGRGVLVVFSDRIYSARFVTKTSPTSVTTMNSLMHGCMGTVNDEELHYYYHIDKKHTTDTVFDVEKMDFSKKVQIYYFGVGGDPETLKYMIGHSDGVVIAGAGDGVVSSSYGDAFSSAKIPLVDATRTGSGSVSYRGMESGYEISAADLNPQKAAILLTLALEVTDDPQEIAKMFYEY